MTRQELIEKMTTALMTDEVYNRLTGNGLWDSGSAQFDWTALAEAALDVVQENAKVLVPVSDEDFPVTDDPRLFDGRYFVELNTQTDEGGE